MMKWEYKQVGYNWDKRAKTYTDSQRVPMEQALNQLGQEGWELAGFIHWYSFNQWGNIGNELGYVAMMKRPVV
jgi:hypothetical protein